MEMTQVRKLLLIIVLVRLPSFASDSVQDSISKLTPGRRIEVLLNSQERVVGRLGVVQPDRFMLTSEKRGGSDREVRFDEVRSVKTKMTTARKWTIAGGVYGALVVLGLILGK